MPSLLGVFTITTVGVLTVWCIQIAAAENRGCKNRFAWKDAFRALAESNSAGGNVRNNYVLVI